MDQVRRGSWPWATTAVVVVLALLPHTHAIVGAAWRYQVTDWLRDLWVFMALGGAALILVLAGIETLVRRRLRARRMAADPASTRPPA